MTSRRFHPTSPLHALVPAAHTPFHADGTLASDVVPAQAEFLAAQGVKTVFITGSSGEGHSLTSSERCALYGAWATTARDSGVSVIAHVGGNSIEDAKALARRADELELFAISAVAPSYYRPAGMQELVEWCAAVAGAAPNTSFYYYDIPGLTGVSLPMEQFLDIAPRRIPTFAGVKFANPDLVSYRRCLDIAGDTLDLPWGVDETLLGALATGARGAVGSTYNWAPRLYLDLIDAFARGDFAEARRFQSVSIAMIDAIAATGFLGTAKALMCRLGVAVGPARPPLGNPSEAQIDELFDRLRALGFDSWGARPL